MNHYCLWCLASATSDLRLPSQPQCITTHWMVPNYTAWWQRHMCVNKLPRVTLDSGAAEIRTCDLLIASPAPCCYATEPHGLHNTTPQFQSLTTTVVAVEPGQGPLQCTTKEMGLMDNELCVCRVMLLTPVHWLNVVSTFSRWRCHQLADSIKLIA